MDQQQAKKILDLTDTATPAAITSAHASKLADITQKRDAAPTDALKSKFNELINQINQAKSTLLNVNKPNPLTQTKLADLPGSQPFQTQMENGTVSLNIEIGQLLSERYEIKEKIGSGGMGAVYRAFDKTTDKEIALKVLLPGLLKNQRAKERFLDEAKISQQLSHPNIVNVFDVQQDGDFFFLTMELLEGQDLRQVIQNHQMARQAFTVEEVIEFIKPICEALQYAHKFTVHRDIKPENIWLTEEGDIKIMDFGIARIQSASQHTKTGMAMGTAYYMAPEQLKGAKNIDGRADQYALAVLIYELLAGEVPAGMIEPLQQIRKDIPKNMAKAIHQSLSPKPEKRFENCQTFLNALEQKGASIPSINLSGFNLNKLFPIAAVLIVVIGLGAILSSGGLGDLWDSIKPVSKEEIARQQSEVAKLQGEIKIYKKRLDNGQRNLKSDVKDAERNDSKQLKYLQYWQRLTDLFI